uniref:Uncharacterized protein n=1 Tax=Arundo donax TaxID=35708 RepID=A0A0A9AJH1_ARUDO
MGCRDCHGYGPNWVQQLRRKYCGQILQQRIN